MKKRNLKNNNGITLIALVISIIVMLLLANVSINAVLGENGIINQAKDARLMTELSDELFNLESMLVEKRIEQRGKKMSTRDVLTGLSNVMLYTQTTGVGSTHAEFRLEDSKLEDMHMGLNGDVYLNNDKRAKISLSDLSNEIEVRNGKIAEVIDGEINQESTGFVKVNNSLYSGVYRTHDGEMKVGKYDVIWTDENCQIVAISKDYSFYPTGIKDYELLNYPLGRMENIIKTIENKYLVNCTSFIEYNASQKRYDAEVEIFHYLEDTYLYLGQAKQFEGIPATINGEETTLTLTMDGETKVGGCTVTGIDVCFAPDIGFSTYFTASVDKTYAHSRTDSYQVDEYLFYLTDDNIKQMAKYFGVNRLYYTVRVRYKAWARNEYDDDGNKTRYYYVTEDRCWPDAF